MYLRRRRNCVIRLQDNHVLDLKRFLRGTMLLRTEMRCDLLCPLTGEAIAIDPAEVPLLSRVSALQWTALETIAGGDESTCSQLRDLAKRGILLSDPPSVSWPQLAEHESDMDAAWWDDLASVYHAHASWRSVDSMKRGPGDEQGGESLGVMIRQRGTPPTHFPRRSRRAARVELDLPDLSDNWLKTLRARCTTRAFRADLPLPLHSLEYVLHTVFGVHGIRRITEEIAAIRRTSPSAGAMHPIDAFVLAINVDTLGSGLYHYEADSHCLAIVESMDRAQARDLARNFMANQEYLASAHVLIIQVARFDRNFWKYPKDRKAYGSVLLDAGHLSQTFYLAATRRELGVFFTSAINDGDIADRLGLDRSREAAIGINGLGIPDREDDSLHLKTEAFVVNRSGRSQASEQT